MAHSPRNGLMGDTDPQSDISVLTQIMSNLLPGFRIVLESICNNPQADCIE